MAHPIMKADDRNWERGTWYTGVMEAWDATHDATFLNQAIVWGRQNNWQFGTELRGANRLFCVQTWAELYLLKKDPAMIAPATRWLDAKDEFSPAGAKRWYLDGGLPYVDSLYGAPALAMLAKGTGRQEYLTVMDSFFDDITATLLDRETGLYYRDPSFIGKKDANGRKILCSRGNGWAFAGIARVLEYLPENDPRKKRYVEVYQRWPWRSSPVRQTTGFGVPTSTTRVCRKIPRAAEQLFLHMVSDGGLDTSFLIELSIFQQPRKAFSRWSAQ